MSQTVIVHAPGTAVLQTAKTQAIVARVSDTVAVRQTTPMTVVVTQAIPGPPGPPGGGISTDPGNRATLGSDNGLYVRDDLVPDPLAYYILAKA